MRNSKTNPEKFAENVAKLDQIDRDNLAHLLESVIEQHDDCDQDANHARRPQRCEVCWVCQCLRVLNLK